MPIYMIKKPGFKKLLAAIDGRYVVPGRKYTSSTAIPVLYNKVHKTIEYEVQLAELISSTADLWSSWGLFPYMSYTIHFTVSSLEFQSRCLKTFLCLRTTLERIFLMPSDVFLQHGSWQKTSRSVSQLTMELTLSAPQPLQDRRDCNASCLGTGSNDYQLFLHKLERASAVGKGTVREGLPPHNLVADYVTSWGSTEKKISRILEKEEAI